MESEYTRDSRRRKAVQVFDPSISQVQSFDAISSARCIFDILIPAFKDFEQSPDEMEPGDDGEGDNGTDSATILGRLHFWKEIAA